MKSEEGIGVQLAYNNYVDEKSILPGFFDIFNGFERAFLYFYLRLKHLMLYNDDQNENLDQERIFEEIITLLGCLFICIRYTQQAGVRWPDKYCLCRHVYLIL